MFCGIALVRTHRRQCRKFYWTYCDFVPLPSFFFLRRLKEFYFWLSYGSGSSRFHIHPRKILNLLMTLISVLMGLVVLVGFVVTTGIIQGRKCILCLHIWRYLNVPRNNEHRVVSTCLDAFLVVFLVRQFSLFTQISA